MSGTAKIHRATLRPTKLELLRTWLPTRAWFAGDPDDLTQVASYRFVDPDGEVGIETLLVRSGELTYQVPLTYRGAPLDDAASALVGTMDHSVLGPRWVYDAVADPVYVAELFRVIHEGDTEADLSQGEKTMSVEGSGIVPVANAAGEAARLVRVVVGGPNPTASGARGLLVGRWRQDDTDREQILAVVR